MGHITLPHVVLATAAVAYFLSRRFAYPFFATVVITESLAVFVYVVGWLSWLYPTYFSELRHVPTVPGFPLWGQFFTVITQECGVPLRQWHQEHGPVIRYFFPFGSERLSVADDEALKQMTIRNSYNYPKPQRIRLWMSRVLGDRGVLLAEGQDHVHQRKSLAPGFSTQSIRDLAPVFWSKSLLLASCWQKEMHATGALTKSFEVLEWLNRTTLDIIGQAGFGYDINSLEQPETPIREAYRLVFAFDVWSRILHGLQAYIPSTVYIPVKMNHDIDISRRIIVDKATEIIQGKDLEAKEGHGGKDIIALIARDNRKRLADGEMGLSFETMRDQIMTFLGAGHDTTATGVAWTLHLLSVHTEIQTRLREEIRSYLPFLFDPDTRFDPASLNTADHDRLPYLDKVCRESLRFIPPIPMTVRQSLEDDTLGGYHVPGGTILYIHSNVINRMPVYWGNDADKFDPDRWDNLPEGWTNSAFMTFLQGPRGCIGRKFAETEMKVLLCCLLSMYEFKRDESTADPAEWKMWRLVLRPKDGVSLQVTAL